MVHVLSCSMCLQSSHVSQLVMIPGIVTSAATRKVSLHAFWLEAETQAFYL